LSCAKLIPTQAGSGRLSVTSPDLQMDAKGLPDASRATDATWLDRGAGASFAAKTAPEAAMAARRIAAVPIAFSIAY
jgi:hypothetical protein